MTVGHLAHTDMTVATKSQKRLRIQTKMDNKRKSVFEDLRQKKKQKNLRLLLPRLPDLCAICQETIRPYQIVSLNSCSHNYCKDCIQEWSKQQATCPQCRKPFSQLTMFDVDHNLVTVDVQNSKSNTTFSSMKHVYELASLLRHHFKERRPYLDLIASIYNRFDDNPFHLLNVAVRTQLIYWDIRLALLTPEILDKSISPFMLPADQFYTSDSRLNVLIHWAFSRTFRDVVLSILSDEGNYLYHQKKIKAYKIYNIIERFYTYNRIPFNVFPEPGGLHEWFMMATVIVKNNPMPQLSMESVETYRTKITHVVRLRGTLLGLSEKHILEDVINCNKGENESRRQYAGVRITLTFEENGKIVPYDATVTSIDRNMTADVLFDNGSSMVLQLQGPRHAGVKWRFAKDVPKTIRKPYRKRKKKEHTPTERQQVVALKPKEVGRLERIIMEIRAGISDTMGTKIWLTNISESDLRIIAKKVGVLNSNVRATKADLIRLIVNRIELEEKAAEGLVILQEDIKLKL
eukprot:g13093.t1